MVSCLFSGENPLYPEAAFKYKKLLIFFFFFLIGGSERDRSATNTLKQAVSVCSSAKSLSEQGNMLFQHTV